MLLIVRPGVTQTADRMSFCLRRARPDPLGGEGGWSFHVSVWTGECHSGSVSILVKTPAPTYRARKPDDAGESRVQPT